MAARVSDRAEHARAVEPRRNKKTLKKAVQGFGTLNRMVSFIVSVRSVDQRRVYQLLRYGPCTLCLQNLFFLKSHFPLPSAHFQLGIPRCINISKLPLHREDRARSRLDMLYYVWPEDPVAMATNEPCREGGHACRTRYLEKMPKYW